MSSAPRFRLPTPAGSQWPASIFKTPQTGATSSNLSPTGIGPSGGASSLYQDPGAANSPFSRSGAQIGAITTQRQKGFTIVDINPYTLPVQNFPCLLQASVIGELTGYEMNFDHTSAQDRFNGAVDLTPGLFNAYDDGAGKVLGAGNVAPANPFWRTVELDFPGNWLKIDYLPARVNCESLIVAQQDQGFAVSNLASQFLAPQHSLFSGNCYVSRAPGAATDTTSTTDTQCQVASHSWRWNDNTPNNTNKNANSTYGPVNYDQEYTTKTSSNDYILINFEDTTIPPIIGKPGMVFKLPFNKIFITVKIRNPKVRVTIGNNAEIVEPNETKLINSMLHMAPGRGILDHSLLHPVPFSWNLNNSGSAAVLAGVTIAQAATGSLTVLYNSSWRLPGQNFLDIPDGVSVGWITGLQLSVLAATATAAQFHSMTLDVARIIPYGPSTGYVSIKNLVTVQGWTPITQGVAQYNLTFDTPIRFVLKKEDTLRLFFNNPGATAGNQTFAPTIQGYTMGALRSYASSNTPANRGFRIQGAYTEHPYPQDDWTCNWSDSTQYGTLRNENGPW